MYVLSVFEIDFHHLNTFSDVFLVGQSLVISSDFYIFRPLLHVLVNCPFLKKRKNRFPPTIDPILHLISPPHGIFYSQPMHILVIISKKITFAHVASTKKKTRFTPLASNELLLYSSLLHTDTCIMISQLVA